jgi:hypothetical protein
MSKGCQTPALVRLEPHRPPHWQKYAQELEAAACQAVYVAEAPLRPRLLLEHSFAVQRESEDPSRTAP